MAPSQSKSPLVTHFMTMSGSTWHGIPIRRSSRLAAFTVDYFKEQLSEGHFKLVRRIRDRNHVVYEVNDAHTGLEEVPRCGA